MGAKAAILGADNEQSNKDIVVYMLKMSIELNQRIITGLLLLLVVGFGVTGCGRQDGRSANSNTMVDTTNRPDAVVAGATIYLYEGTIVTTEIKAELIHKFDELDSTMGYVLDIDVFDSSGNVVSTIVGDSGVIREHDNSLHLFGNVVVLTDDSTRLETDNLRWDPDRDKIETEAFVKIRQDGDIITGWGLESDRSLTRIKILKQVSGTLKEPDGSKENKSKEQ